MEKTLLVLFFLSPVLVTAKGSDRSSSSSKTVIDIGVILDLGTLVGKMGQTSISMAVEDFYATHKDYDTRLNIHFRDSNSDVVQAASKALDLMQNVQVQTIIGPQKSQQASFVIDLGNKTQTPIISFSATSPSLSSTQTPYFVQATLNDSSQVNALSSIIKAFGWREAVLVYEDTDYGRGIVPYLVDALQEIDAKVPYRSVIPLKATDDQIMKELYKMMTMQTRIFIVQMSAQMGARLFSKAKETGMMTKGYSWIMTDGLSNVVDSFAPSTIDVLQGVLGIQQYIPKSMKLEEFTVRWKRRFKQDHQGDQHAELSIFALMAYDTTSALAIAAEKVGARNFRTNHAENVNISAGIESLPISTIGPKLLEGILKDNYTGVSGEFNIIDGQLQPSIFQIINVIGKGARAIGYWSPTYGLSRQPSAGPTKTYSTSINDLNPIIWPGESALVPRGWDIPTSGKKLKIGVPVKQGYREFVDVKKDPITNVTTISGYNIDVFEAAVKKLPYDLSYDYIPFENATGQMAGTYNDLVYQVYLQNFDAVVGDTTVRANRTRFVDFTLPYTPSGISMIVAVKESMRRDAWIFLKPLTLDLWLGSLAFFLFTGIIVWLMEHQKNSEFQGPIFQQLGTVFYFSFSTLVFAHKEKVENILTKIVVIVWVFVVLILTSSYTASLTSMLTVEQLQPTVTTIQDLLRNGDYVGYFKGSFMEDLLLQLGFHRSKLRSYCSADEFAGALFKGSKRGGVTAVVHEIPYIKVFLAKRCKGFTMIGPIYHNEGFGFVFPRGSPLAGDVSRALLKVLEGDIMKQIEQKWLGDQNACLNEGTVITSDNLSFKSFWGLFLITGTTSACALLIFLAIFIYKNWNKLKNIDRDKPIQERVIGWLKYFAHVDLSSQESEKGRPTAVAGAAQHPSSTDNHEAHGCFDTDDSESRSSISGITNSYFSPSGGSSPE